MQSFRTQLDPRRQAFVLLAGEIERQLREAYDRKYKAGLATQSSLAARLGVNRSAVHHRLMGHTNMTIETIADMVWALDHAIKVQIYDPTEFLGTNYSICLTQEMPLANSLLPQPTKAQPVGPAAKPGHSPIASTLPEEFKAMFPENAASVVAASS